MIWHFSYVVTLCTLVSSALGQSGSVAPPVSVNGLSEVPSPTTTVTSTVTGEPTTIEFPYVSAFPVTITRSGLVIISTVTETLGYLGPIHSVSFYSGPSATSSSSVAYIPPHSSVNKGAIAGGILGGLAVIVAGIAVLLWSRRRSRRHWRNWTQGKWNHLDGNGPPPYTPRPEQIHVGEAVHNPFEGYDVKQAAAFNDTPKQPDAPSSIKTAPPPLLIRESHRQSTFDPFADPLPSPPSAHKRSSSYGLPSPGRHSDNAFAYIEMDSKISPTRTSEAREKFDDVV